MSCAVFSILVLHFQAHHAFLWLELQTSIASIVPWIVTCDYRYQGLSADKGNHITSCNHSNVCTNIQNDKTLGQSAQRGNSR